MITIDGSQGEGGGQIVRTAVSLAASLTQPIRLQNIRAGRAAPGLAAQHLTAVRAAAITCDALLHGDELGSTELLFEPQAPPTPGLYAFDVAQAREGGSAGAAPLVVQTLLPPLALADEASNVTVRGGTHVAWSPSFHYLAEVYLPALAKIGWQVEATLREWGWYPAGEGEIGLEIDGQPSAPADDSLLDFSRRGELQRVRGLAISANLPSHIAQRIRNRAANLLDEVGLPHDIQPQRVRSVSPGAGIFLTAEYEHSRAGFSALGKKGKPSEVVAQEAVDALLAFHRGPAAIDSYLADQLLLPLLLTHRPALLAPPTITPHTRTNAHIIGHFLDGAVHFDDHDPQRPLIRLNQRVNQ